MVDRRAYAHIFGSVAGLALAATGCRGAEGGAPPARSTGSAIVSPVAPEASSVAPPLPDLTGLLASAVQVVSAAAAASAALGPPPPCPADMELVGRVCVDRFEAHLLEVRSDGSTVLHDHAERPQAGARYQAANAAGAFAQGYISRVEAKAACELSQKRLCTMSEWRRACRGKGWMTYPYAQVGARGRCNTGKLHLLTELFERPRGGMKYDEHFNAPELNRTPGYLAPSGEYERCVSDRGIHDMVGNLHEWVSDTVSDELMERLAKDDVERRDQPWRVGNGVFLGGFFSTTSELGPGCLYTTVAHEPTYHDYSTGFRCCKAAAVAPSPKVDKKR